MNNQCQNITLTLSDGRRIRATVKVFCSEQEIETLKVVDIEITAPIVLPDGYEFEVVEESILPKSAG